MSLKSLKNSDFAGIVSLSSLLLLILPATGSAGSHPAPPQAPSAPVAMRAPVPPPAPAPEAELDEEDRPKRGWLGVFLSDDEEGVSISGVKDGSPAEKAGLSEGDKIVEVDSKKVEDSADIRRALKSLEPGDAIQIVVMRDGKKKTLTATLGEAPELRWQGRGFPGWAPGADFDEGMRYFREFHMGGSRTYLGVRVQGMTEELRAYFKAPRGRGVLVSRVEEGTPAAKAGLKAGDVIVAVDGKGIAGRSDIGEALGDREPGDRVAVKVIRDGVEKTLDVEVAERHTPRPPRRGALALPGGDGALWLEDDDDDGDAEVHELEVIRGDPRIRIEIERTIKDSHEAMKDSVEYRRDVERAMKDAQRAMAEVMEHRQELQQQIRQTLRETQEAHRMSQEEVRRQVREAMDQAREALRQAVEAARPGEDATDL